jgi:hypothetical protein
LVVLLMFRLFVPLVLVEETPPGPVLLMALV